MAQFKVACVQLSSGRDIDKNLEVAGEFIRKSAAMGADYVQTPEVTTLMERDRERLFAIVEVEQDNRALVFFSQLAKELGIWLHIGSMAVKISSEKLANRAYIFAPNGEVAQRYDKIHMFDVELANGHTYHESANYQPGEQIVSVDLPWGKLGLSICYDVRFSPLYEELRLQDAQMLAIPAAFTQPTGEAHWHILLRARAIETQCYVLAAAQTGKHEGGRATYGHSLIVDPQGGIIADAGKECGIIMGDILLGEDNPHNLVRRL